MILLAVYRCGTAVFVLHRRTVNIVGLPTHPHAYFACWHQLLNCLLKLVVGPLSFPQSAFSFAAAAAAATTGCVNIHSHATRRTISIGGVVQIKRVDAHPRVGTTSPATSASGNDGSVSQVRQRRYTFQSVTNPGTCLRVVFRKQKQYAHRAQHLDKPFNLKDLKVCWSAIQGVGAYKSLSFKI